MKSSKKKKDFGLCKKIRSVFGKKNLKKILLKEDSHSWDKFVMHASHTHTHTHTHKNLTFNPFYIKFQNLQFCNQENFVTIQIYI